MRPHDYLLVLLRNWLVIATTVLIGISAGFGVSRIMPTEYGSSVQVLFTGHATTSGQDLAYVGNYTQGRIPTYERLAESTSILTLVKRSLGSPEKVADLRSRIGLSQVQDTAIVTIRTTDGTRAGATRTASAVAGLLKQAVEGLENGTSAKSKATVSATVIGKPESSTTPVSPKLPLNLLIGALAGLGVSVGVITVREALRAGRDGAPKLT